MSSEKDPASPPHPLAHETAQVLHDEQTPTAPRPPPESPCPRPHCHQRSPAAATLPPHRLRWAPAACLTTGAAEVQPALQHSCFHRREHRTKQAAARLLLKRGAPLWPQRSWLARAPQLLLGRVPAKARQGVGRVSVGRKSYYVAVGGTRKVHRQLAAHRPCHICIS